MWNYVYFSFAHKGVHQGYQFFRLWIKNGKKTEKDIVLKCGINLPATFAPNSP